MMMVFFGKDIDELLNIFLWRTESIYIYPMCNIVSSFYLHPHTLTDSVQGCVIPHPQPRQYLHRIKVPTIPTRKIAAPKTGYGSLVDGILVYTINIIFLAHLVASL